MKNILLFGAGKSATCLIDYLALICPANQWKLTVADNNRELLNKKLAGLPDVHPALVHVENPEERDAWIEKSDLVVSLLPPSFHILVARSCVAKSKNMLTASYVDEPIRLLQPEIDRKGLFFLYEMGLDPGIDHMSAKSLIDRIRSENGEISVFRSHTGGLVAPESDDNPWHYKISWNPRNVVRAGSSGAVFRKSGQTQRIPYQQVFVQTGTVTDKQAGTYAWYPNRDSLIYMDLYGLEHADTFIRTTLRHPDFCRGWKDIVAAGLTDDLLSLSPSLKTIADWSKSLNPYVSAFNKKLFDFLGLFDHNLLPGKAQSSADVLQSLVETKWKMGEQDKDLIVMIHELVYSVHGKKRTWQSSLKVKGESHLRTAMARTVGLPLGIAARLILENKIQLKGLHIPVLPEIYQPVLRELELQGIRFCDTVS